MKNLATATCIALGLAAFSSASLAATVNIAGTQSTVNYHPVIDTSVLFDPNSGPVTASGTIDLSSMGSSGVLFVGLISKVDYDRHIAVFGGDTSADFFGFVDTVYGAFTNTANKAAGLGQYLQSGETTQTYAAAATVPVTAFEIVFGDTSASLTVQALPAIMLNSNFTIDNLTFTSDGSPYTDFSQGAYAFIGAYVPDGSATYDVTFSGPQLPATPLPAALPLFGSGLGIFGLVARRRRRRRSAAV
jgi:hypothetical protein